ncbi:DUF6306 domain-containing protein [Zavarzinia compransoris]|uniref:DUF6306 domain-containing protein n=1 Tax=Zavarzinia marina TaxID=2911065 RepID=UPI001F369C67|nr:DUF6306 domain-containing protein [Zavarzinia marina]MCF4166069.1 DUF6306 domain-containing protein [Zavarzinia marina]
MTSAERERPCLDSEPTADADGLKSPCFDGPLSDSELDELINLLIESIRAGAKVAAVFACRASCQDKRGMYLDIQADCSRGIQELSRVLKARGIEPSDATNGFFDRAMELPERADRIAFFVRGQAWLHATLQEALPHIQDADVAAVFRTCAEQVERNRQRALAYQPAA